jgi:hypothetical protein
MRHHASKMYSACAGKVQRSCHFPAGTTWLTVKRYKISPIRVKHRSTKMKSIYHSYSSSCREPGSDKCVQLYQWTHCIMAVDVNLTTADTSRSGQFIRRYLLNKTLLPQEQRKRCDETRASVVKPLRVIPADATWKLTINCSSWPSVLTFQPLFSTDGEIK